MSDQTLRLKKEDQDILNFIKFLLMFHAILWKRL